MRQGLSPSATLCDDCIVSQESLEDASCPIPSAEPNQIKGYHAHVYYASGTRLVAERLRQTIAREFTVEAGELRDEPRGPHPIPQFNVIFNTTLFDKVVPWLMLEPRRPRHSRPPADRQLV
jgi:Dopa 4,5-dioxygenase family